MSKVVFYKEYIMRVIIKQNHDNASIWAADYVAYKIKSARPTAAKPFTMAIPAGSSPLGLFSRLIDLHKKGKISFENVVFFNLNEYVGLKENDINSYHFFLWDKFFQYINVKSQNIHLLDAQTKDFSKECANYEKLIRSYGGIDLLIGGVGEDGHIAFNEPGSSLGSRTRVKTLNQTTIHANARFFNNNVEAVPHNVLTVGIATIMDAKEVMIVAYGDGKSKAILSAIEGPVNHMCPISILQMHPHTIIVTDTSATAELKPETVRYFNENEDTKLNK